MYFLMVIDRFVHRFRFFLSRRSISMHADARGTNKTYEQKKSGTTPTTRKAPFAAWNPRFVSHENEKKIKKIPEREGDRETRTGFGRDVRFFLGNYGNGTEVCFQGTVTTYTFTHEIKGGKKNKK